MEEEPPPEEEQPQVVEVTFPEVEKALDENRFADATEIIGQRRGEAGPLAGPILDVLNERALRGKALSEAVAANPERVKGLRITVTVAGMRTLGKVKSASPEGLAVDAIGMECKIRFQDIRPSTLHRLAGHAMKETPQNRLLLTRFLVDIGSTDEATEVLGELRKDPEVGEEARRLLSDL